MKKTMLSFILLLMGHLLFGQNIMTDQRRFISVTGSAEITVPPDEIELKITLKEYYARGNHKIDLPKIETKFLNVLDKHHIDKESIVFGSAESYYWYYWWNYRNDDLKQKSYLVKLGSSTNFLSFVQDLNMKGVTSLRISKTTNKQLQTLRKEIKISAVKAAKEKAKYLLESIGEKVGKVISIEEVPENRSYYWQQNMLSNSVIPTNAPNDRVDNVAAIKLRYEVKARFEIE